MSLLLIARKVWRYKLATLPILALIVVGAFYAIAVKTSVYEAASTYILVNPPPPPTDTEIAHDPSLGRLDSDNPYTRFSDQTVLVQVLSSRLTSEEGRAALAKRGADPSYTAAPSAEFGSSAPILQITGTGPTPAAAVKTAELVGTALTEELTRMQKVRGVSEKYRIKAQEVVAPHGATLKASGKLRMLVAVFGLGVVLMFLVVSVADALSTIRAERAQGLPSDDDSAVGGSLEPLFPRDLDSPSVPAPDPDPPQWHLEARK
jgi:hypothetical protein